MWLIGIIFVYSVMLSWFLHGLGCVLYLATFTYSNQIQISLLLPRVSHSFTDVSPSALACRYLLFLAAVRGRRKQHQWCYNFFSSDCEVCVRRRTWCHIPSCDMVIACVSMWPMCSCTIREESSKYSVILSWFSAWIRVHFAIFHLYLQQSNPTLTAPASRQP